MEAPRYQAFWRGKAIGHLTPGPLDMWYCDAVWTANDSQHAISFEALASALEVRDVFNNPSSGLLLTLSGEPAHDPLMAMVLGLEERLLSLCLLFGDEAKRWARQQMDDA